MPILGIILIGIGVLGLIFAKIRHFLSAIVQWIFIVLGIMMLVL